MSNKLNRWPVIGSVVVGMGAVLSGCGGSSGSSGAASLRLVNATLTHPSLDLLVNAAVAAPATAADSASAINAAPAGTDTVQLNDAGSSTALISTSATLGSGLHYTLLAYGSAGAVKTTILTEDFAAPAAGTAQLRVYDTDTDAGSLDVYITDPATDLAGVASPTFSLNADLYAAQSPLTNYSPVTYCVRVTGAGNKADLRIDIPAVTLASQQVATVVLTPASGGLLLNGASVIQQGSFAATHNSTARVRLAAAVSGAATVAATAGATTLDAGSAAPGAMPAAARCGST